MKRHNARPLLPSLTVLPHLTGRMKRLSRLRLLAVLTVLCASLAAIPARADSVLYSNYPINGTVDAYTINEGYEATDSFFNVTLFSGITVDQLKFGVWLYPGDTVTSVSWSLDTLAYGVDNKHFKNTNYGRGAGCLDCGTLSVRYLSTNEYGYEVAEVTISNLNGGKGVSIPNGGGAWLTLKDAVATGSSNLLNDPVFWDVKPCSGVSFSLCPAAYYGGPPAQPPTSTGNSFQIIGH